MRYLIYFLAFLVISCAGKSKKQGSTFFFYPVANVYYDIEQKDYYVFDSSAHNWKIQEESPTNADSLGRKVLIEHAAVPVYKDNEQHRLIYGTALYTSASEVRRKYIEDSLASLPPPVVTAKHTDNDSEDTSKQKKKGFLKRLWDKIFK